MIFSVKTEDMPAFHLGLLIWSLTILTACIDVIWIACSDFTFDFRSLEGPAILIGSLLWAQFCLEKLNQKRAAAIMAFFQQILIFVGVAGIFCYLVVSASRPPFADASLESFDKALGFDWVGVLRWVDARPTLVSVLRYAYATSDVQIAIVSIVLIMHRKIVEARIAMASFVITLLGTIIIAGFLPAVGTFAYFSIDLGSLENIHPFYHYNQVSVSDELRSGVMRRLSWYDQMGVLTCPSFHAAMGTIYILSWLHIRPLALPGVMLNLLLIAASPIQGSHYLADILAGCLLAAATMYFLGYGTARKSVLPATVPNRQAVPASRDDIQALHSPLANEPFRSAEAV